MQKKLAKRLYQKMRYEKIPLFFVQNFLFFVQKIKNIKRNSTKGCMINL